MLEKLWQTTYRFFQERTAERAHKVLLGLSGGPDSLALFHMILAYTRRWPARLSLGIAHVDHGWRPDSAGEEAALRKLADSNELPYFSCTLDPLTLSGNLEDACRQLRIKFFRQVYQKEGFTALALGHHGDDQAETVIKRIFEGSHLEELAAMQPVSHLEDMLVWRPLLSCRKAMLTKWLTQQNIAAFDDATNRNPRFLRCRLRQQILPTLSSTFGKQIHAPLCRLADEAQDLDEYLDTTLAPYLAQAAVGPYGPSLDLQGIYLAPYLERHLIRRFCRKYHAIISRAALASAAQALTAAKGSVHKFPCTNKTLGPLWLIIERRYLALKQRQCADFVPNSQL